AISQRKIPTGARSASGSSGLLTTPPLKKDSGNCRKDACCAPTGPHFVLENSSPPRPLILVSAQRSIRGHGLLGFNFVFLSAKARCGPSPPCARGGWPTTCPAMCVVRPLERALIEASHDWRPWLARRGLVLPAARRHSICRGVPSR